MRLLFADGINIGFLFIGGIIVLVPLMAFEVFVEAWVLKKMWSVHFQELCGLTFRANCWSLLAGIPTKILNAYIYSIVLPQDIPGFFARYPIAIGLGSFIYLVVTVLVECITARRWLGRNQISLSRKQIWQGILVANIATYAVLSPIYYFTTKPYNDVKQFSNDTRWTSHPGTTILFISQPESHLKSIQADGSALKTIVPFPMADYLISSNLNICLFRGTNGNLYLYRRDSGTTNLIWQTTERYFMDQVAFSPSGDRVAFASESENYFELLEVKTGNRVRLPLPGSPALSDLHLTWSPKEEQFFVRGFAGSSAVSVTIESNATPVVRHLEGTNAPPLLKCYERTGAVRYYSDDWGVLRTRDKCGDLEAGAERGLGSSLRIFHRDEKSYRDVLTVAVNPGMLHIGGFYFGDVEFLDGCNECLFESNGYLYVLDINGKHLGTLAEGHRFIQLTTRNEKPF
jgi:hypothetical protein